MATFLGEVIPAITQGEAQTVVEILGEGKTEAKVVEVFTNAASWAADTVETLRRQANFHPKLACRAGCFWCCYQYTEVTAPEALVAARYLRETLSAEELRDVTKRVADLDDVTRGLDQDARFELRRPCALLVDGLCTSYEARPLACRGWNSLDADKCKAALDDPDTLITTEVDPLQHFTTLAVDEGLSDGLEASGLKGGSLEFTAALRIALETPDALDRWLTGEDVFGPASTYGVNDFSPRMLRNNFAALGGKPSQGRIRP